MSYNTFIGIDPGKGGAIAIISVNGIFISKMLLVGDELDILGIADYIRRYNFVSNTVVCIEKVSAMPGQGVTSMFTFGFVTGILHGIVATLGIPKFIVTPQKWKKIVLEGLDWKHNKNMSVSYCHSMYPDVSLLPTPRSRKLDINMADALCIARYAQMVYDKV